MGTKTIQKNGKAGPPSLRDPDPLDLLSTNQLMAIELLLDGNTPNKAAKLLARKLDKNWRVCRRWMVRWYHHDEAFKAVLATYSHMNLGLAMPRITMAVANRAARGNPNMARLAMEASGFHNPKVDHKHSGEIKISITGIPRPSEETQVIEDAEVVEE